jgi:ABC-type transporter Mla subunit MlaD
VLLSCRKSFLRALEKHTACLNHLKPARFNQIPPGQPSDWLTWLSFQASQTIYSFPTRSDAAIELDNIYFNRKDNAFIQRAREYAPFIGLLLTAFSAFVFYLTEGREMDLSDPGRLIRSILPLLMGVAIGAMLSVISSALAQELSLEFESFRRKSLSWYDEANAHLRQQLSIESNSNLASEIEKTNHALSERISFFLEQTLRKTEEVEKGSQLLQKSALNSSIATEHAAIASTNAVNELAKTLSSLCVNLNSSIGSFMSVLQDSSKTISSASVDYRSQVDSAMRESRDMNKAASDLNAKLIAIADSSLDLKEVVSVFRDTIGPAAISINDAAKKYSELTDNILVSKDSVDFASHQLVVALNSHTKNMEIVNRSINDILSPISSSLLSGVTNLEKATDRLNATSDQAVGGITKANDVFSELSKTALILDESLRESLLPAISSIKDVPVTLAAANETTDLLTRSLALASRDIEAASTQHLSQIRNVNNVLANMEGLTKNVSEAITGFNKTATSFSSVLDNLQQTSDLLYSVNSGLGPVAVQLGEFLSELRNFGVLKDKIDGLSTSLGELQEIAANTAKAQRPLTEVTTALSELEAALIKLSGRRPGIWVQILKQLKLQ